MCENCERTHFTVTHDILERQMGHTEIITVTRHFKWILTTLELTAIARRGGYKILAVYSMYYN